jgi:hypothetical protein
MCPYKQDLEDFTNAVLMKITEAASEKGLTNEEYLVFLSKVNEGVSNLLTYLLSKSLPR